MAVTPVNSEDRLVQGTFADHLERVLGWESIYAWNEEDFGPDGTLGRADTKEAVLTRDLRAGLERLNPDLPASAIEDALRELTVYDVSRSMVQHNRDFYRLLRSGVPVEYRDAQGHQKSAHARVIDFDDAPGSNRFLAVRELKLTGVRTPNYNRRADLGLFRQRPAAGLHRVEGGPQEHPRGLRQQPLRLHGRERHRPRLPPQRLPDRVERRPRPLRLDHQRLGAFLRMEAARRGGQGQRRRRGAAERHAGA